MIRDSKRDGFAKRSFFGKENYDVIGSTADGVHLESQSNVFRRVQKNVPVITN